VEYFDGGVGINVLGYIAVVLLFVSFQMNDRKGILGYMTAAMFFLATHQFLLGALAGAVANSLVIVRNLFFRYKNDQPLLQHIIWPYLFCAVMVAATLLFWQGWHSLLPAGAIIAATYALWADDPKTIRRWSLVSPIFWLPYAIIIDSVPTILIQVVFTSSILIAMWRFDRK